MIPINYELFSAPWYKPKTLRLQLAIILGDQFLLPIGKQVSVLKTNSGMPLRKWQLRGIPAFLSWLQKLVTVLGTAISRLR